MLSPTEKQEAALCREVHYQQNFWPKAKMVSQTLSLHLHLTGNVNRTWNLQRTKNLQVTIVPSINSQCHCAEQCSFMVGNLVLLCCHGMVSWDWLALGTKKAGRDLAEGSWHLFLKKARGSGELFGAGCYQQAELGRAGQAPCALWADCCLLFPQGLFTSRPCSSAS